MAAIDDGPDQYEVARQRAKQQNNAAVQGQQDALKRRFASLGSINSGAAIKQGQLAAEQGEQNLSAQTENINSAQRAENLRVKELQANRDFAKSERLGSQDFAGLQADLGRKFSTSERLGSQDFSKGERIGSQSFVTGERMGSQDFSAGQQDKAQIFAKGERLGGQAFAKDQNDQGREFQKAMAQNDMDFKREVAASSNKQFEEQMVLANKQFVEDQATTAFNKAMAEAAANKKDPGMIGGLFKSVLGEDITNPENKYMKMGTDGYKTYFNGITNPIGTGARVLGGGNPSTGGFF